MTLLLLTGCYKEDDIIIYKDSRRWVEKTVAVVAPLNDPIMKSRLERTASWMKDNLHQGQLRDTLCIQLKLEWYDEYGNDLDQLGKDLSEREDLMAVIGPFDSDNVNRLAPYCHKTGKPLILPTATSETVIRRFAITSTGSGQKPFMWSLTETDVSLSEVLMSNYANFLALMDKDALVYLARYSALFTPADTYGQTFFEWTPFQAKELDISFEYNKQYAAPEALYEYLQEYYELLSSAYFLSFFIPSFIVAQDAEMLYQIARIRSEWMGMDPDNPEDDARGHDGRRALWAPVYFALSNLTDEAIEALGPRGKVLTNGYQGYAPYADPTTGFELSYESRYDTKPTFAECKFYDALLLTAFAGSYLEHHPEITDLNDAIIAICTTDHLLSNHAWNATGIELYLSAMENGQLIGFKGASGPVQFDKECYTAALNTTYVNWIISEGRIRNQGYFSASGSAQTGETLASWNWAVQHAEERFDREYGDEGSAPVYPALSDQYAVLVQGSNGWQNYRHETDVLNIYQLLKAGGYDDDHIILIIADDIANAPENPDRGAVRTDSDGVNLRAGAIVDYKNADLAPADIVNILKGVSTARTPVVLPSDAGQNVLLFWSGHGHSQAVGGINEMAWRDNPPAEGMTADLLAKTISQMAGQHQFRQMLVCLEPCYSANIGMALEGIPGVLAICSAGPYEQSFADSWSNELNVWMCDRFSRNLAGHTSANPNGTYRDLYLYCARHTLGSHVGIFNHTHFGNLYINGPKDFFIKKQP